MKLGVNGPILILVRGLPGSGKSYISRILAEKLGQKVCVLDPDATDYSSEEYKKMSDSLSAEGVDEKFYPYRFLRGQAYSGIEEDKVIIWNQAFTNLEMVQKTILNLQTFASEHSKQLQVVIVELEIDPEVAKRRVANRASGGGHDVDAETFNRFIADYKSFEGEGFKLVKVNGEDDASKLTDKVIEALQKL